MMIRKGIVTWLRMAVQYMSKTHVCIPLPAVLAGVILEVKMAKKSPFVNANTRHPMLVKWMDPILHSDAKHNAANTSSECNTTVAAPEFLMAIAHTPRFLQFLSVILRPSMTQSILPPNPTPPNPTLQIPDATICQANMIQQPPTGSAPDARFFPLH